MTKDLRDTMRMESNIHVVESWKEGKKESSAENILKEIMAEKFPLFDKRHKPKESTSLVNIKLDK